MNPHEITKEFEKAICDYTGAPYCVAVDNASNALYMCLVYIDIYGKEVFIPKHTYPSVPCEIIFAGGKVRFKDSPQYLTGEYQLEPFPVWDSALRFTADMYMKGQYQCLSFTGQWKQLKMLKAGAILTDDFKAYNWFKRFRFSGRRECSYHDDYFDMIGKNYYLHPIFATIGLQLLQGFYNIDGTKKQMPDISLPYPDLSKFPAYKDAKIIKP